MDYFARQSMIRANPLGFAFAIVLIPALGAGLLLIALVWLRTHFTVLEIGNGLITLQTGVLRRRRLEIPLSAIRAVSIEQGVLDRFMGIGTVAVTSAGDLPELRVADMPDIDRVRALLAAGRV